MSEPTVRTVHGEVRGRRQDGCELFVEIPYASSTSGENRFKPPAQPQPWAGVRDATSWTVRAPQNPDPSIGRTPQQWYSIQGVHYAQDMSEDCLTVNVWTPSTSDGGERPVLLWIHGGGYVVGHAACHQTDGANFAREHDVVFVSVTHRLNAFGFLHLAGHDKEFAGSGALGLLDIIGSLEWIRDNIVAFGGDPTNVTVIGESGGAAKVSKLLGMPRARGLFHRAVCESGVALSEITMDESSAFADLLIEELGGRPGDPSRLLTCSMDELLAAQASVEARSPDFLRVGPVADGDYIPLDPIGAYSFGHGTSVPVLAGSCRDEVTGFRLTDLDLGLVVPEVMMHGVGVGDPPILPTNQGLNALDGVLGCDVSQAASAWLEDHPDSDEQSAVAALLSDVIFRRPAIKLAEARDLHGGERTFIYQLDWASPRLGDLGACHSTGVPLFFLNHERVAFTRGLKDASSVAAEMSTALATFMRTGIPDVGTADWASYTRDRRTVMSFATSTSPSLDPDGRLRSAWDQLKPRPIL